MTDKPFWETKSLSRLSGSSSPTYVVVDENRESSFKSLLDAGNAACGALHLPHMEDPRR